MAMTAEQYQTAGLKLLPVGVMWNKSLDSQLSGLMLAQARSFARIDDAAEAIAQEIIPSSAAHLLTDYEHYFGVPEYAVAEVQSISARRTAIKTKDNYVGSLAEQNLIAQAKQLGYNIKIINRHPHHIKRGISYPLYPQHNWYVAFVYIDNLKSRYATVLDGITTTLKVRASYDALKNLLERYKPAHINLIYIDEV